MKTSGIPKGLKGVSYTVEDLEDLTEGASPQRRPTDNTSLPIRRKQLKEYFKKALAHWKAAGQHHPPPMGGMMEIISPLFSCWSKAA